jgi:Rod binding domain-containing protein
MSTLPPIDSSVLPAEVRNGTPAQKKNYETALSFERMLVQQLTKSMVDTTKSDGSGSGDGSDDDSGDTATSAATSTYQSMLPDVLADGITSAGGLGLAQQIYEGMK